MLHKKGAEYAYEMIINSFASGDKKNLKTLLTKKLYLDFEKIIDERNEKKLKSDLTFVGMQKLSIDKVTNVETKYKVTAFFMLLCRCKWSGVIFKTAHACDFKNFEYSIW